MKSMWRKYPSAAHIRPPESFITYWIITNNWTYVRDYGLLLDIYWVNKLTLLFTTILYSYPFSEIRDLACRRKPYADIPWKSLPWCEITVTVVEKKTHQIIKVLYEPPCLSVTDTRTNYRSVRREYSKRGNFRVGIIFAFCFCIMIANFPTRKLIQEPHWNRENYPMRTVLCTI